ncbi:uncharacterized protein LOC110923775 [Helianthus annuus]|uniref:uncharacterized protein LOC110923775 n=1 Tax=Helianthus annuus TaxID=4232 RepID=UPI000B8FC315|nr:uncharacterized protein LOC110923775 [Helianthus annuus]
MGVENGQLTLHLQWSRLQLNPSELAELSDLTYAANAVSFEVGPDRWMWSPESSGLFTVRNIRKIIEEKSFPNDGFGFFWNRWVPLKINLLVWRLVLDRLPTTTNLSRRNVQIPALDCKICHDGDETASQLFFHADWLKVYGILSLNGASWDQYSCYI